MGVGVRVGVCVGVSVSVGVAVGVRVYQGRVLVGDGGIVTEVAVGDGGIVTEVAVGEGVPGSCARAVSVHGLGTAL